MDKKKKRKKIKKDPRRTQGKKCIVLYKRNDYSKSAHRFYRAENTPSFMQFNHLIYRHVKEKYSLSYAELNLLLMVAPITPFSRKDFLACREIMDYKKPNLMSRFTKEGFVYIWRKTNRTDRIPTLFDLTQKGKDLVRDIHDWGMCEKKIPEVDQGGAIELMAKLYYRKKCTTP